MQPNWRSRTAIGSRPSRRGPPSSHRKVLGPGYDAQPSVMADRKDIDFSYSLTDRVIRLSLGELADFSGAKYDGDFSMTLEQAQRRKHEYLSTQVGVGPGRRLLDLGCGWGALLDYVRGVGGTGVGVTLSSAQLAACRRHGLDV